MATADAWSAQTCTRLQLHFAFTWASVQRGLVIGFVIAIVTVLLTSVWLSRFNIIQAIRDINEPPRPRPHPRAYVGGGVLAAIGGLLTALGALGISFVGYAPLSRSLLTGTVHGASDVPDGDRRRAHPRFQDANLTKNVELVRHIEAIAREKGCTPAQLVLAWLLAQGPDVVPIPGTKRRARLEENLGAIDVPLSGDDVKRIDDLVPAGAAAGLRYPEPQMKAVFI